jgi:hypothetical protein
MENKVDISKAFQHLFDDPEWVTKTIIGALLTVVPILNFVVYGYEVRVVRNVAKGQQRPLPTWDDFGGCFTDGLYLGLARIVYGLPMLVFLVPFFFLFIMPLVGALAAGNSDSHTADRIFGLLFGLGFLLMFLSLGLMMIYGLLLGFSFPAITANYVKHGTFASCFDFKSIIAFIRTNFNNYLMVWLTGLIAGLVVGAIYMAVSFIPCIGTLVGLPLFMAGAFFILMASGHALGQALAYAAPTPASVPTGATGAAHELPAA